MSDFRAYTCWDREGVRHTIFSDVGAIDLDQDAVFLATHVSLPVEQRKPGQALVDERAVLQRLVEAIDESDFRNLVIAVTGPSGSGKSHLVRWLRAHLDPSDSRIEVVYVPRRVTSLREITLLLLNQLGGALAEELEEQVEQAVAAIDPIALAETLLNRLWELLKFRPPPGNVQYAEQLLPLLDEANTSKGRGGLAYLLGHDKVRSHLLRPDGTLAELARSVLGRRIGGDTEKPSFAPSEFDLARLAGIRPALPQHALTALNMLGREAGQIAAATLMNAARDTGIQEVLGMRQGRGLREVFADARKRLRGRQLVLMFEDLALMDFVEGAVLDEFANHGDADHAPLRVVFAVTDDKYATLEETIEGRVTDQFWIGEVPLHDVAPGEVQRRDEFFARYLNAARVGRDSLVGAHDAGSPVPNACKACVFCDDCHAAFGAVETDIGAIGFYPYNRNAITHGVAKQFNERHRTNRVLTPRTIIEQMIDFVLVQAYSDLTTGSMPSEPLTEVLNDGSALMSPRDLVPELDEGTEELARVFRVRSYWFDLGHETPAVAAAFSLPTNGSTSPPQPQPPPLPSHPPKLRNLPDATSAVMHWEQNGDLDPRVSTELRQLLRALTEQRLDLERYLIHSGSPIVKDLLKAALGDASFEIEDAPGASRGRQLSFTIPRSNAGSRLLVAAMWLRDHGHWLFADPDRKWDLPGTKNPDHLAIELETFLADCVFNVEAAVVSTLFVGGEDPVRLAVQLSNLAAQAIRGEAPPTWASVALQARSAITSSVSDDVVLALAAARQSPTSRAAVIDSVRTTPWNVDQPLPLAEGLREYYPALTQRSVELVRALDDAVEPTIRAVLDNVELLNDILGSDTLPKVGEAAIHAGRSANNEKAFDPNTVFVDFENAAQRLRETPLDADWWIGFEKQARSFGPNLRVALSAIPHAANLLEVVHDLRFVKAALVATRELLDKRLVTHGGVSLEGERRRLIEARDRLVVSISGN